MEVTLHTRIASVCKYIVHLRKGTATELFSVLGSFCFKKKESNQNTDKMKDTVVGIHYGQTEDWYLK